MNHRTAASEIASQFVRFAGVGVIGTAAHYLVLILLVQGFGVAAVAASCAGALAGALVNYILNYRYTFRSTKRHRDAMSKFLAIAAVAFAINGLMMAALVEGLEVQYLLAQVITTGVLLLWTFAGNRLWTFRERPNRVS